MLQSLLLRHIIRTDRRISGGWETARERRREIAGSDEARKLPQLDDTLAVLILILHLMWILWVIFGAFWTSGRRWWTVFHVASLVWGTIVEIAPWPCPLTMAEDFFQSRAGLAPYRGSFLLHYVSLIVYPNVSVLLLTICGVAVCAGNLAIYAWRASRALRRKQRASSQRA